ncbi:hypothetical protein AVEN_89048-1 [Araneus ventricosus]|uniref:Uncharacterized protein n=1 Tax=Araneus ventricosus TaxID=182803 RepID=A0A4Y2B1M2_ARAVE|nr:hypothetical protein AVEN_89048-1 [Araneus ventricosus]
MCTSFDAIHSLQVTPNPVFSDFLGEPRTASSPTHKPTFDDVDLCPGSQNGVVNIGTGRISNFSLQTFPNLDGFSLTVYQNTNPSNCTLNQNADSLSSWIGMDRLFI